MKVVSVNVGLPRPVKYNGEIILTGIFKEPVGGKVKVNEFNLEGDRQADLQNHGGWSKAIYAYPCEHYEFWKKELPGKSLPFGIFGENLTVEGLLETEIFIGDVLKIGTAKFIVTEPRFPCFKLGIRFNRKDIIKQFQQSGRLGFYLAVARTGELQAADKIEIIARDKNKITVSDLGLLRSSIGPGAAQMIKRALRIKSLPEHWRKLLNERAHRLEKSG